MKLIAKIPPKYQDKNIKYLELETDEADTSGVFIYFF